MKVAVILALSLFLAACGGGAPEMAQAPTVELSQPAVQISAPVIVPTQPWEANNIEDGSAIKVAETIYRFYCAGAWPSGSLDIGYATATSFPNSWTKYAGNPIVRASEFYSGNGKAVCAPRVIAMPDGSYRMYVHATDGTHDRGFLLTASASDFPNHWSISGETFREGAGWDGITIQTQTIIPAHESPDGQWHLMYAGYDGSAFRGGHATSADGISWQRDLTNPIMDQGGTGWRSYGVLPGGWFKKDGVFYILAQGFDGHTWSIGYYSSSDLKTFTPSASALLTPKSGHWNASGVEGADALMLGSDVYVFYVGSNLPIDAATYRVGVEKLN
jgi:hypothetical protein